MHGPRRSRICLGNVGRAYIAAMRDEILLYGGRSSWPWTATSTMHAARIPAVFAAVSDLEHRVLASTES